MFVILLEFIIAIILIFPSVIIDLFCALLENSSYSSFVINSLSYCFISLINGFLFSVGIQNYFVSLILIKLGL